MLSSCDKVCYPPTLPLSGDLGTVLATILLDEGCYLGFAMQREVRVSSDSLMTLSLSVKAAWDAQDCLLTVRLVKLAAQCYYAVLQWIRHACN